MSDIDGTSIDVQLHWRQLRMFQFAWLLLFLGFIPVLGSVTALLGEQAFFPALLIYGGLFLYTGYKVDRWKCPRCQKSFFRRLGGGLSYPFRSKCANCGLGRNSDVQQVTAGDSLSSPAQSSPQQQS